LGMSFICLLFQVHVFYISVLYTCFVWRAHYSLRLYYHNHKHRARSLDRCAHVHHAGVCVCGCVCVLFMLQVFYFKYTCFILGVIDLCVLYEEHSTCCYYIIIIIIGIGLVRSTIALVFIMQVFCMCDMTSFCVRRDFLQVFYFKYTCFI